MTSIPIMEPWDYNERSMRNCIHAKMIASTMGAFVQCDNENALMDYVIDGEPKDVLTNVNSEPYCMECEYFEHDEEDK